MKILIVEDNNNKFNDIRSAFEECGEINITRRISRNGTLVHLANIEKQDQMYDLIILDMQIPTYEDDPHHILRDGGMQVFKRIQRYHYDVAVAFCSSEPVECEGALACIQYNASLNITPLIRELLRDAKQAIEKQ